MLTRRSLVLLAIAMVAFAGCGGDGGPALSPAAEAGRATMLSNGCASCHGANGQGGVGPAYVGLYGSEVVLADGTTVTADEAYLRESITDPAAKKVEGYQVPMPTNNLTDAEVDEIIAYITELAATDSTLSAAAETGHDVARSNGCSACHGANGEGGVASAFVGLYGSEVTLDDGSSVVADEAYIRESIVDPDAQRVAGYDTPMPSNDLDADQVDALVAYITELGSEGRTEGSE